MIMWPSFINCCYGVFFSFGVDRLFFFLIQLLCLVVGEFVVQKGIE